MPSAYADALAKLETLYAMIPAVDCQGLCTASCGPLALSYLERKRLQRTSWQKLVDVTTPQCPLLKDGRCSVYQHRPTICRLYATTENMVCPFGCVPERYLTVSEWQALLHVAEEISQALFPGKGPCSFHRPETILKAQEASAEATCAMLWGA